MADDVIWGPRDDSADKLDAWRKNNFGWLTPKQNDQLKAIIKSVRNGS